jgi:hypothetical protein
LVLADGCIQAGDAVALIEALRIRRQAIPAVGDEGGEAAAAVRDGVMGVCHVESLAQRREELIRTAPLRVAHDAVVGQDLHLVVRKEDDQEGVVLAWLPTA